METEGGDGFIAEASAMERVEQPQDGLTGVHKGVYLERRSGTKETKGHGLLKPDIDGESGKSGASEHVIKQSLDVLETLLGAAPRNMLSVEFVGRLPSSQVGNGHIKGRIQQNTSGGLPVCTIRRQLQHQCPHPTIYSSRSAGPVVI